MNTQIKRIEQCADVLPGFALKVRAEHEPEGSYYFLMAKDLKDSASISFQEKNTEVIKMNVDKNVDNYLLRTGDAVFISRGARNEAAVIGDIPANTIASSTFYILRPKAEINSEYLVWCINQLYLTGGLDQIRTGAATPIIQRHRLKEVEIPVPSLEEQERIAALARVMDEEIQVQNAMLENTRLMHRVINKQLLNHYLKFE
ncbi:MAG: restriction endonuclease subunit S [Porticoccaceae bacterium]